MPNEAQKSAVFRIVLPDETVVEASPLTFEQVRRALGLHPADPREETPQQFLERLSTEVEVLFGGELSARLLRTLTIKEVRKVVAARYVHSSGFEPHESFEGVGILPPVGLIKPAAKLLSTVDSLALCLRATFPTLADTVETWPVRAGFAVHEQTQPRPMLHSRN